jgi:uncharacterized membrane protein YkoI
MSGRITEAELEEDGRGRGVQVDARTGEVVSVEHRLARPSSPLWRLLSGPCGQLAASV